MLPPGGGLGEQGETLRGGVGQGGLTCVASERLLAREAAHSCTSDSAPAKMAVALQLCAKSEPCSNRVDSSHRSTGRGESSEDDDVW